MAAPEMLRDTSSMLPESGSGAKLSLIIPVFNASKTLALCLESCVEQTYANFEIIVIDGGSTDGSVDIIRSFAPQLSYWVSERDGGIYDAWNKGLGHASGEWLAFFGADDAWSSPDSITQLMNVARFPAVNLVTARLRKLAHGAIPNRVFGEPWSMQRMRTHMTVAHAGMPHHRSLFDRHGKFDTGYRIAGDYDFLLRVAPDVRAAFVDAVVADMGGGGVSSTQLRRVRDESVRALTTAPTGGRFWAAVFWLRFGLRHWRRLRAHQA